MRKLLFLILPFVSVWSFGQQSDATTKSNTDSQIRNAALGGVTRAIVSSMADALTDSKVNRSEALLTTGTNDYTITPGWTPDYSKFPQFKVKFVNGNSGAVTVNTIAVKKNVSSALSSGDIPAGAIYDIVYDGTNFQITLPGSGGGSAAWGGITGTLSSQTDLQSALTALQPQLNGTGFVKATGTTISYDNSAYLTALPTLSGDVSNSGNVITVTKINGTSLAALATGIVKNTTTTGVLSIATGADLPAMTATVGGAVPTPPNNTTTFLRGDGTFAAPSGSGTVNAGTAGQIAYYATSSSAVSGATTGTGVLTALGVNVGSAGAPVLFNGAGGTPSSLNGANITSIPESGVTNLTSDLALKALKFPSTRTITTSDTPTNADAGNLIEYNSASGGTITIQPTSTGSWTLGTLLYIEQKSTGNFTVASGAGVTFINQGGLSSSGAGSFMTAQASTTADTWYIFNGVPGWNPAGNTTITANTTQTGAFKNTFALNGLEITQNGQTGTPTNGFKLTPGAHTSLTASTVMRNIIIPDYTWSWATGNVVGQTFNYMGQPTIQATGASNFLLAANYYFPNIVMGSLATGTATPSPTAGNYAIDATGIRVSNPSFTGGGFLYQSGNGITVVGGGPAGENIQFGGGNSITASATFFSGKGFTSNTAFSSSNQSFRAQVNFTGTSGSTSPAYFAAQGGSISIGGTYTGKVISFLSDQTYTGLGSGGQVGFESRTTLGVISSGTTTYQGVLVDPIINTATSGGAGTISGFDYNPTETDLTNVTQYGVRIFTANARSGFGTSTPTAKLHIAAGSATASTAPLKFTAPAALLATPEALVVEPAINGDYLNLTTTTGTIRRVIVAGSSGRATAQTAANNSVATYTLGATDASYEVSANVLVTTSSAENFTVTVSYTDEGNTARVLTMNFQTIGGTIGTTVAFANGAVPYEGLVTHLRCKASTSITVKTVGTFTGATYNVEGIIKQTN